MNTFTAIDFEVAQGYRYSVCQIGLVRVVNGNIVFTYESLIKPPVKYFWQQFTDIHGITMDMVINAPTFDKVWPEIKPYIINHDVVAHNIAFDASCLEAVLNYYGLSIPPYNKHCTCVMYGWQGLGSLCKKYKIPLNHHDALSDAMACATLFLNFKKLHG